MNRRVSVTIMAIAMMVMSTGSAVADSTSTSTSVTSTSQLTPTPTPTLGESSWGVTNSSIIAENDKAGTAAWRIGHLPPRAGVIDGFADTTQAIAGQAVSLYVQSSAPSFTATFFRMGYYHGLGARQVFESPSTPVTAQPQCHVTTGINLVDCANWHRSLTVTIGADFTPGDYLILLTSSMGAKGYVLLTVADPTSTATYEIIARSLTEEGWNLFGGYDYYRGVGPCTLGAGSYPPCNRARVVSFTRPQLLGNGASDFFGNEFPLVFEMEKYGLDVTYVTDVGLDQNPTLARGHKVIISLGHDETWTYRERQAVWRAFQGGTNVIFFGAAAVLRHARLAPNALSRTGLEVNYRDASEDPLSWTADPMDVTGNTFSAPPTLLAPITFTGETYAGYDPIGVFHNFVVYDPSSFLFANTGLHVGSVIPVVLQSDFDHAVLGRSPANFHVVGHSPLPLATTTTGQGQWGNFTYSDAGYWTNRAGGGVFDSGTVNWISTLTCQNSANVCQSAVMDIITGNLLRVFGEGPLGRHVAVTGNLSQLRPLGS